MRRLGGGRSAGTTPQPRPPTWAVPDEQLDTTVAEWCTTLLGHSPQAMRLTKASLDGAADLALPSVRQGFEALTGFYGTAEFHEGTTAFLERRSPHFR